MNTTVGTFEAQEKKHGAAKHLGQRLREWRKTLHLKSYELAKLIHISQGSLSDIENDKSLPSADTLAKLYQYTNLNIIWLLTGKGNMNRSKGTETAETHGEDAIRDQSLKDLIERVTRVYQKGDPEKRAHLQGFLAGADPGE
jgi:transcriptional regulator with XRE-family HTH domain